MYHLMIFVVIVSCFTANRGLYFWCGWRFFPLEIDFSFSVFGRFIDVYCILLPLVLLAEGWEETRTARRKRMRRTKRRRPKWKSSVMESSKRPGNFRVFLRRTALNNVEVGQVESISQMTFN